MAVSPEQPHARARLGFFPKNPAAPIFYGGPAARYSRVRVATACALVTRIFHFRGETVVRWSALLVINRFTVYRGNEVSCYVHSVIDHSIIVNLLSPRSPTSAYTSLVLYSSALFIHSRCLLYTSRVATLASSKRLLRESKCQFASVSASPRVPSALSSFFYAHSAHGANCVT